MSVSLITKTIFNLLSSNSVHKSETMFGPKDSSLRKQTHVLVHAEHCRSCFINKKKVEASETF